ncbi:MAG: hypothetical protein ABIC95_00110 [archaeon]
MAGTVAAISLSLSTDKLAYLNGEPTVTFTAHIDIEDFENVPVRNVTLDINGGYRVCTFSLDGSNDCPHMEVIVVRSGVTADGLMMGSGFGSNGSAWMNTTTYFGYGHGFIDEVEHGELVFIIRWAIKDDGAAVGPYEAWLHALAASGDGNTSFTYASTDPARFEILPCTASPETCDGEDNDCNGQVDDIDDVVSQISFRASGGLLERLGSIDNFSGVSKLAFSSWLSLRDGAVQGSGGLQIIANDGLGRQVLNLGMRDIEIVENSCDRLHVQGSGPATYWTRATGSVSQQYDHVAYILEHGTDTLSVDGTSVGFPFSVSSMDASVVHIQRKD